MKKLFLILISICMLCSFISMSATAEDSNIDVIVEDVSSKDLDIGIEETATEEVTSEENTTDTIIEETITEEIVTNEINAEEIITEDNITEEVSLENTPSEEGFLSDWNSINENDSTSSTFSDDVPEISLFSAVEYSNEQKAAILRDFLVERLNNLEKYRDELSLGEYNFDDSGASDALYVDLSGLYDFSLYYDEANQSSTKEIIKKVINDISDKSPRTFWCETQTSFFYNKNDYKLIKLVLRLNFDKDFDVDDGLQPVIDEVHSLTAEFDNYVQSIVDLIPDSYTDYEKILFVNDYLCTNYKYDTRYYTNNAAKLHIANAYDFFKEGKGVCQAYTLAFMAIMDELGIRCDVVSSEDMKHIWNIVELNGKWYHIDVTWNDPCFESLENDTLGKASHKYFLLSTKAMQDSEHKHYGFDVDSYGYEFGTEFDNIKINLNQSLTSSFIELNGTWYNTGYNTTAKTCGLYAFNSPDISSITNNNLKKPLYKMGAWPNMGSYSYLAKYKDTILFNTPTSICVFDGNKVAELYIPEKDKNESIYGFTVRDNQLLIQLSNNPYEPGMTNATVKTANLVDIVYKNYDGTILAEGFAVEGADAPDLFISEIPVRNTSVYYDYSFDKWVTEDGLTFVAEYTKTLKEGANPPVQDGITVSSIPNDKVYGDTGFKIDVNTTETTPDLGAFELTIVDNKGNVDQTSKVATIDEEGNVTIKAAGTTYIKVSRNGDDNYADFEQISALVVMPKEILVTPTSDLSKYEGQEDVELTYTYEEDKIIDTEEDIITGTLTRAAGEEPGVYNINLGTLKINDNYNLILPEEAVTFEIKAKLNQDVMVNEIENTNVYYGDTLTLSAVQTNPDAITSDDELTEEQKDTLNKFIFSSSNEKVATVDENGNVQFIGVGEVKITISNTGNFKYNQYEKVFTFNVSKREITLSAINFDEKTVTFINGLEADTNINLDFNKLILDVMGVCEEDNTKSNVKATNLILTGEKADCYNLSTKEFEGTVTNTNIINVNPKAENGSVSGVGNYLANIEITLTATANNYYMFNGWYCNGTLISTNATYTFNTSELEDVEAKFSKKPVIGGGGGAGGGGGGAGGGSAAPSTYIVKFETNDANLTIANATVESGQRVKTPEVPTRDGYKFDGWYTDKDLTEKYDFNTEVKKSFTLYAKWIEEPKETDDPEEINPVIWHNPFVDVDTEAWYYDDVKSIVEKNLMTGTADDTFSPNAATTRGMIVTILYRLEGEPSTDTNNVFEDVNSTDYYGNAVAWAVANNIVNGVGDGKFAPNDEITREQFAAILYRYASFKGLDVTTKAELDSFSDNEEISTWATDAIAWANANGIISGTSTTTISPQNGAIRAQAAAMLNRFTNLNNK